MAAAEFLIPAGSVPVAAQVGGQFGHYHQVTFADRYPPVTAGADVALAGCVRLYQRGGLYAEWPGHSTSATAAGIDPAAMKPSTSMVRRLRKRLMPTGAW